MIFIYVSQTLRHTVELSESFADGVARVRALDITADQFHRMRRVENGALQEKHADAVHRMYEGAGLKLKTATEAEKASFRLRLIDEARKRGMRFPA
jgi:KaiC/GvpD/RAD55 family RecA-like ATPase